MSVVNRDVSMDLVKQEGPDEESSSDSEARNLMVPKQSCPNELLPTVKQELVDSTDDYVCGSVDYPFLNKVDSTDTLRAVDVKPDLSAIKLCNTSVTRVNSIRIYNKLIVIEPMQEVHEGSCNKLGLKDHSPKSLDTVEVKKMLWDTTVEPVLESIKCEPELIEGLDDGLPHQSLLKPTRTPADLLLTKKGSISTGSNNIKLKSIKINSSTVMNRRLEKRPTEMSGVKPLQCDQCNYTTNRKFNLTYHKKVHLEVKRFQCEQCDFATNFKRNFNVHRMVHTGVKPFQCDDCGYSCARKESIRLHVAQHTGVKSLQCNQCEYATNRRGDFERHLKIHSGIRPYLCNECDYSTIEARRLKQHLLVHSGIKPFRCDQCDYSATYKHSLKQHMYRHLQTKPLQCIVMMLPS